MSCNYVLKGGVNKGTQCPKKISKSDPENLNCCSHVRKEKVVKQTSNKNTNNNIQGLNFNTLVDDDDLHTSKEGEIEGEEEREYETSIPRKQQYNYNNQQQEDDDASDLHASEDEDDLSELIHALENLQKEKDLSKIKTGIKNCILYARSFTG